MSGQNVVAEVYLLPNRVIVDLHKRNGQAPMSIDRLLSTPIAVKALKTARMVMTATNQPEVSPQVLYSAYSTGLEKHFGQHVLFEGDKDMFFWSSEEPRVTAHVTEYASFAYKHIEPLHGTEDRLVHCVIPPSGKSAQEVYETIVATLDAREK